MISARRFRNRVTAGLVLIAPVWITFLLAAFVFRLLRDSSLWVIEALLTSPAGRPVLRGSAQRVREEGLDALSWPLQWSLAAFAVVVTILLLYLLGFIAANVFARRIITAVEALVDRIPLLKTVYRASQQVLATLAGDSARPFRQVVLIPFPNERVRSVGFVTRESRDPATGEETYNVFVSTTPNPTTGFMLVVRREEATVLDWSVEEAVKAIMSGGVLMPESLGGAATAPTAVPPPRDSA